MRNPFESFGLGKSVRKSEKEKVSTGLEKVRTTDEIEEIYGDTEEGSEEQEAALQRWNEISLGEIEKASTTVEIEKVLRRVPPVSEKGQMFGEAELAGYKKWLSLCKTGAECQELYSPIHLEVINDKFDRHIINNDVSREKAETAPPEEGTFEYEVVQRWTEISLAEVERASTVQEMEMVLRRVPPITQAGEMFGEAEFAGYRKWLSLCKTGKEVQDLYSPVHLEGINDKFARHIINNDISREKAEKAPAQKGTFEYEVVQKWNEISLEEIEKTSTTQEIEMALRYVPPVSEKGQMFSEAELAGYRKWLSLCKTGREFLDVYNPVHLQGINDKFARHIINNDVSREKAEKAPPEKGTLEDEIVQRWTEVSLGEIEKASTPEEVEKAERYSPQWGKARNAVELRMKEIQKERMTQDTQ